MRVITGTAKGCRLETLAGEETRPTTERVKEGIFSAIAFEIEGRRVLDLFAGSGQMGIEALSRGAKSCVFVDANRQAAEVVRRNLRTAKLAECAEVYCGDALSYAGRAPTVDLVFLDPPYASDLLVPCMEALADRVSIGGTVVCECDRDMALPETVGVLTLHRQYRYGRIAVHMYRRKG